MTKVYIEKENTPELTPSLVFWPNFRFEFSQKRLFLKEIMDGYTEPFFEIVSSPEEADFFAAPFDYIEMLWYAPEYLQKVCACAAAARKKILL